MPYISVIIPVYSRTQYVNEAINSVLNQTLSKDKYEIIVVTNVDLPEREGVKIIKSNERWQGPKFAQAIEEAKGEIISLLDDDDLFLPNKLEVVYKVFKENEKIGLFKNPIKWVNELGKEWLDDLPREPITITGKDLNLDKLSEAIKYKVGFNSSSFFRKREILNYLDYLKEVKLVIDAFIGLLFLFTSQVVIWNKLLSVYRVLSISTSRKLSSLDQYIEHKRTLERIAYEDYMTQYGALKSSDFEKTLEKIVNYQKIIVKLWSKDSDIKLNLKEALNSLSIDDPKTSKLKILTLYLASSLAYFLKKVVYKRFYKKN